MGADELAAVRAIVDEEFAAYGSAVRAASVTPTVVALRAKAATVVDAELTRLAGRLSEEGVSTNAGKPFCCNASARASASLSWRKAAICRTMALRDMRGARNRAGGGA